MREEQVVSGQKTAGQGRERVEEAVQGQAAAARWLQQPPQQQHPQQWQQHPQQWLQQQPSLDGVVSIDMEQDSPPGQYSVDSSHYESHQHPAEFPSQRQQPRQGHAPVAYGGLNHQHTVGETASSRVQGHLHQGRGRGRGHLGRGAAGRPSAVPNVDPLGQVRQTEVECVCCLDLTAGRPSAVPNVDPLGQVRRAEV